MNHVVVVKTEPSHVLHLILTLLTCGLWLPVWVGVSIAYSLKRNSLSDEPGRRLFDFRGVRGKVKIFNFLVALPFLAAYLLVH